MRHTEIMRRLADLFQQEGVTRVEFDPKTYDDPSDFPHIMLGDKRIDIHSVSFDRPEREMVLQYEDRGRRYEIRVPYNSEDAKLKTDEVQRQFHETNLYGVVSDAYYELDASGRIGDFELDFLKN